jgi:hypothetical protein
MWPPINLSRQDKSPPSLLYSSAEASSKLLSVITLAGGAVNMLSGGHSSKTLRLVPGNPHLVVLVCQRQFKLRASLSSNPFKLHLSIYPRPLRRFALQPVYIYRASSNLSTYTPFHAQPSSQISSSSHTFATSVDSHNTHVK